MKINVVLILLFTSHLCVAQNPLDVELEKGNVLVFENTSKPHYLGINILGSTDSDARNHLKFYHGGYIQSQIYTSFNTSKNFSNLNLRTFSPEGDILFQPNSLPRVFIDGANGRVGINTISPSQQLHVVGHARFGASLTEYTEIGHGGAHGFVNTVGDGNLEFRHDGITHLKLLSDGKLVVGSSSTPGDYKIYVDGGILTEEVKVAVKNSTDWADDAFAKTPEISEVESSINDNSHLKDMPSAEYLVKNGYDLREMDANLLRQIEWIWMHMIDLKKQNDDLKEKIRVLEESK